MNQTNDPQFQAGYVAIVGKPNAGKSTLMNMLLGQKLSIVSNKPQTTRHKILGILSTDKYQIVFLDTPGLLKPKYQLHEAMMKQAQTAITDADSILYIVDVTEKTNEIDDSVDKISGIKKANKNIYLILNKSDLLNEDRAADAVNSFKGEFKEKILISALKQINTDKLLSSIIRDLPLHPPYFPLDAVGERSERFFVAEIIREKIFEKYREEIPYSTAVEILDFKERGSNKDFISAEIFVERDSQKGILIGKKGQALKEIGELARKDIEQFLGRSVFLELYVKVRKNWKDDPKWVKRLGYDSD